MSPFQLLQDPPPREGSSQHTTRKRPRRGSKLRHRFFLSLSALCLTGCATLWTSTKQYAGADLMLARGNFSEALSQMNPQSNRTLPAKDRALIELDTGMLQHYQGNYEASNRSLETAEQAMDNAFVKSLSRGAASLLLNDNVLTYAGEDYENIYVNVFKALNYIALDDFDAAFVEIRRIDEKLTVLESRYWKVLEKYNRANELDQPFRVGKNRFQNSALGRWLSLQIYRAEGRLDEAAIDLKKIERAHRLQPDISPSASNQLTAAIRPTSPGKVHVSILGLIGQAPEKRADTLWIHTQENQLFIAGSQQRRYGGQQFTGANMLYWPGIEPGYTFKFQLPYLKKRSTRVHSISVLIDGQRGPTFTPLESLENAAIAAFEIKKPLTWLKTITRTVTKGLAAAQAQHAAEKQWGESPGLLAGLLAGIGLSATEHADLRIARFLPAQAHVAELQLTPGPHTLLIQYRGASGSILHTDTKRSVEIHPNKLNLIESFYLN